MGETIPTWKPACNPSVSIQLSGRKTSSDGGAFLLREIMDRSGVRERLGQQLQDHRPALFMSTKKAVVASTCLIAKGFDGQAVHVQRDRRQRFAAAHGRQAPHDQLQQTIVQYSPVGILGQQV